MTMTSQHLLKNQLTPCLELRGVQRTFLQGDTRLDVLKHIDLCIYPGELVALVGPSGAGKSTLLHIAGLLEVPNHGHVFMNGYDATSLPDDGRTELRRHFAGFVYQAHHLLPEFTALENVMMPMRIAKVPTQKAKEYAEHLLQSLKLEHRLHHKPSKLSGGEQQRVAIARALANEPKIIIADEPTGNLDPETALHVFKAFQTLAQEKGVAALIATHNMELAEGMSHAVQLHDGHLLPYIANPL